jgi:hypothetical protein
MSSDPLSDLIARLNSGGQAAAHLQAWAEAHKANKTPAEKAADKAAADEAKVAVKKGA